MVDKGVMVVLDLIGNISVGRLTGGTSKDGEGKLKGGTEGAARFSALYRSTDENGCNQRVKTLRS